MDAQLKQIRSEIAEVLSAVKAKHSLLGIAFLLLIQQSCIHSDTNKAVKQALENVPVCTQTGK